MLAGFAELERVVGRDRIMKQGVMWGPKPKLTAHQRREAYARRQAGETIVSVARSFNAHGPSNRRRTLPSMATEARDCGSLTEIAAPIGFVPCTIA